jgi:RHS repeat-associated protein
VSGLRACAAARQGRALLILALLLLPRVALAQPAETVEYYGQDVIGSIRIVFSPAGAVLARQDYEPFGRRLFTTPAMPREGFGAQAEDSETTQAYFHARMFQSRTGRFSRPDPQLRAVDDPQKLGRYSYARNNPVSYRDFSGLWPNVILPCVWCMDPNRSTTVRGNGGTAQKSYEQTWTDGLIPGYRGRNSGGGSGNRRSSSGGDNSSSTTGENDERTGDDDGGACTEFVDTLTETMKGDSFVSRALNFKASGKLLMGAAIANVWQRPGSKSNGAEGVRPSLTDRNQGNDVFRHVAFMVGAVGYEPMLVPPFMALDVKGIAWDGRQESKTELLDDVAGGLAAVGLAYGVVTGDDKTVTKFVTKLICK